MKTHYTRGGLYTHKRQLGARFYGAPNRPVCGWDCRTAETKNPDDVTCRLCLKFLSDWEQARE